MIPSFKSYLYESINVKKVDHANKLITVFLRKQLKNIKMFSTTENFKNSLERGVGLRFYIPGKNYSFRINWSRPSDMGLIHVKSLDVWFNAPHPFNYEFSHEQSLAKVLPLIVEILKKPSGAPKSGTFTFFNDEEGGDNMPPELVRVDKSLDESFANGGSLYSAVVDIVEEQKGAEFSDSRVYTKLKIGGVKVLRKMGELVSGFKVSGDRSNKFQYSGSIKALRDAEQKVMGSLDDVSVTVTKIATDETYKVDPKVTEFEENRERLTYENQLHDLEHLLKMTLTGAANALFVAGRGGVGKTHTVEKILSSMGYEDNNQYFKNTGSASAAGIYSMLYKYRDKIVFFDDSDDALKDQESRNLFKAATDTKPVRKLVWNKMGKNVIDTDTTDMTDDEIIDGGFIPRYFEFTGKIIFISNLSLEKLDPDGAIRTRAFLVDISPTDEEVYDFMDKIVGDMPLGEGLELDLLSRKRVVKLLRGGHSKQTANFRKLSRGLNMLAGAGKAGVAIADAELARMISMYA